MESDEEPPTSPPIACPSTSTARPQETEKRHGLIPIFNSKYTLPPNSFTVQIMAIGGQTQDGNILAKISDSYSWVNAQFDRKWSQLLK